MEASMHGRFDRSDETSDKSIYRRWGIGVFLLPVLLVAFLIGLAVTKPDVSALISEAVQAELVSSGQATGGTSEQAAPPAREVRTVKGY
jgi:hypothetical protein